MRIALLSSGSPSVDIYPPQGGIQYQIYHTAQQLQRFGHDPVIIKRELDDNPPRNLQFHQVSVPFGDEVFSRLFYSKRAANAIAGIAPDIVFVYERFSAVFPSRSGFPTIFFTSNPDAMQFYRRFAMSRTKLNLIGFPIKRIIEEAVMHRSDQVIALNTGIDRYLHRRNIHHTTVIPNGIDPTQYYSKSSENFILFAGRLNEVKGTRFLIEAFNDCKTEFPELDLVIAGDGEQRSRLEKKARALGIADRVQFTGWLDQSGLAEYLATCELFVLPSLYETFGIVLLEAMASKKPVIASETMGAKSIITSEENGLLVGPKNPGELCLAISSLMRNKPYRQRLAENALKTVESEYVFPHITDRIIDVCDTVLQ